MVSQETSANSLMESLAQSLSKVPLDMAKILDKALSGGEVLAEEGARLFDAEGTSLMALMWSADELRRRAVGDVVTYVVNRNINFTNVCIKRCGFCAFSRDHREEEGYFLPLDEILRRAREAWELGATEVCIQAGLPPKMEGSLYIDLCQAIKAELPDIHVHGFSPEEVLYGAVRSRCTVEEYLKALKRAGVGSLPGTSAEVLDDRIRQQISPGRITTQQWIDLVTTAHKLGIPTTCTIMYGHIEEPLDRTRHLVLLRDIQKATGGFTEFVPLSFIHSEAPMYRKKLVPGIRKGATGADAIKMHAIARIMLNGHISNIQASWVKEGPKMGQLLLAAGANDVGGTLINESISTAAGASFGQLLPPGELRHIIWDMGRIPAERSTLYAIRKRFDDYEETMDPLDVAAPEAEERFGSYQRLINIEQFRYKGQQHPSTPRQGNKLG